MFYLTTFLCKVLIERSQIFTEDSDNIWFKIKVNIVNFLQVTFFAIASSAYFLLTNQTIVFFELALPSLWHPLMSLLFISMLSN